MKYTIILTPDAVDDIQKAIEYYDEQQAGLGRKFMAEVNEYIKALKKNPQYQIRYDNVRGLPLKRYPYMLHFVVEQEKVRIIAVFHTSLNPDENWKKRK